MKIKWKNFYNLHDEIQWKNIENIFIADTYREFLENSKYA